MGKTRIPAQQKKNAATWGVENEVRCDAGDEDKERCVDKEARCDAGVEDKEPCVEKEVRCDGEDSEELHDDKGEGGVGSGEGGVGSGDGGSGEGGVDSKGRTAAQTITAKSMAQKNT